MKKTKELTISEHLANVRSKAHQTQKKNGHFKHMAKMKKLLRSKKSKTIK